jgi:hypothetical protein
MSASGFQLCSLIGSKVLCFTRCSTGQRDCSSWRGLIARESHTTERRCISGHISFLSAGPATSSLHVNIHIVKGMVYRLFDMLLICGLYAYRYAGMILLNRCVLQVPLPSVFAPASKYISLIVPAMNEENRLPDTLDETLR